MDDRDNRQRDEGKETIFSVFNVGIGCIGLIGVLATLIATYFVILQPREAIQIIQQVAEVPSQQPQIITVLAPSQIPPPTYTPYPTHTQFPTITQAPTISLTASPVKPTQVPSTNTPPPTATQDATILFEDDFNDGLDQQWSIESGNPIVVNGALTSDETTWLIIGDSSWTDYVIDFEADAAGCWFGHAEKQNVLAIRMANLNNFVSYVWQDCESYWYVRVDGEWNQVPHTEAAPRYEMVQFHITANGDEFVAEKGDERLSSFFESRFDQGYVGLRIGEGTIIDNFKITSLSEG